MKVSVIIPTLNEEDSVANVIKRVPKNVVDELLVVDGHSTDKTVEVAKSLGVKVITQEGRGLGDAYRCGAKNITGDVMIILDADGSHTPEDIPKLIEKIKEGYDLVIASRLKDGMRSKDMGRFSFRALANRLVGITCKLFFKVSVSDPWMGFRAIKRDVMLSLDTTALGQEIDIEMLIVTARKGYKIGEIKTFEAERRYGESKFNVFFEGSRLGVLYLRELLDMHVIGWKDSWTLPFLFKFQQKWNSKWKK